MSDCPCYLYYSKFPLPFWNIDGTDGPQSYDYTLQKVKKYTRVPLGDVVGISKGKCRSVTWFYVD